MPIESSLYVPDSPKSWYNHFLYQISLHHIYISTIRHSIITATVPISQFTLVSTKSYIVSMIGSVLHTNVLTKMRYTIPSPGILGDFFHPWTYPRFFWGGWLFLGGFPIGIPRWDWRYIPTIPPPDSPCKRSPHGPSAEVSGDPVPGWLEKIWEKNGCYIIYMDVSKSSGTPKSSTLMGFSTINHPFWGYP